ncbi:DUF1707 domain-containing protein [Amycolatopsis rhizosphaerae]|uniref:DUF1707 domain-containing protein n=1 Tax=Amycolatopsis rhizosphaerae TaxID=2053003 RepID=A0A558D6W9_9PSEU|nr:DUF1707 domain-containing protein [Amycolatopsis rhizosphaerae]TVT56760.1 DUF1707 domain-containing protein [Amycolatopsis rhizosphaerae]
MAEDTGTKPLAPRDLRVSDDEREHVIGVLQKAIGRGLLDLDEFTERTDVALAASTRGELNRVLADIPGLVNHEIPVPDGAIRRTGPRLELTAKYSSLVRRGAWIVPPELVVRTKYGSTKLDFSEAQIGGSVVYVELDCKWGSVEVVIPEHASIDLNAITDLKYTSLHDRTGADGRAGSPRLVFSGRVHGGSLSIRYPRRVLRF